MEVSVILGEYTWDQAKTAALNYRGGGYSDWRLPTKEELALVYRNLRLRNLGAMGNNYHWSSAPNNSIFMGTDNPYAWGQSFSDGRQSYDRKITPYTVRAVRAF
jgi:hypothetical protein